LSPDADPLHEDLAASAVIWTRANVGELLPGVLTPLTATTVARRCETAGRAAWRALGVLRPGEQAVPSDVDRRQNAMIHGRLCLNLTFVREVVSRIPGADLSAFEASIGVGSAALIPPDGAPAAAGLGLAVPFARQALTVCRRVDRHRGETDQWWRRTTADPSIERRIAVRLLIEADQRVNTVLRHGIVASMLAEGAYRQLAQVAAATGRPGFETRLVTGYGDLEEGRLADDLVAWNEGCLSESEFLSLYGFQCPEQYEVSARSWREDPAPLVALRTAHRAADPDRRAGRVEARRAAEAELLGAVAALRRPAVRMLLRVVRAFVLRRERQKVSALQAVDVLRVATRALGRALLAEGILVDGDDAVFLTFAELTGAVPAPDARALVEFRKERRSEHAGVHLPYWWAGAPPASSATAISRDSDPGEDRLAGVPASPGVAEGSARVIRDVAQLGDMEAGEILVCTTTDPSWTPALLAAAAIVVDRGGPLSHGAIAARELGVPSVTGTAVAVERIRTGDLVRVDGGRGTVQIVLRKDGAACPG
jgi:phosphohistidine swiveling domain-containing protein